MVGAERDRIVDEAGVKEMATFLGTDEVMLPTVPHEVRCRLMLCFLRRSQRLFVVLSILHGDRPLFCFVSSRTRCCRVRYSFANGAAGAQSCL